MTYIASLDMGTLLSAIGLCLTAATWLVDHFYIRRKRLYYHAQLNTYVRVTPPDARHLDLRIQHEGEEIGDASLVLLRVENGGSLDVGAGDINSPITFRFAGRKPLGVAITESEPAALKDMILKQEDKMLRGRGPEINDDDSVVLPGCL